MNEISPQTRQIVQALSTPIDEKMAGVEIAAKTLKIVANQMQAMCWEPKCVCYLREIATQLNSLVI